MRVLVRISLGALFGPAAMMAQQAPDIASAWDQLIPAAAAPAQASRPASSFSDRFFFETRTGFEHYQTAFTGNPTNTGAINAPDTGVFNAAGIPSPVSFLPGADRFDTFFDFGTRGYGSARVNTHFAMRYRQDLGDAPIGSPAANILETFPGNRSFELLDASVEIEGNRGMSYTFGRLNVYGAEIASFDGGQIGVSRPRFDFSAYGGRRYSFFSDPAQRAIGGANLILKIDPSFSVELETLWYIKGTNKIVLRKRLRDRWLISSYLRSYGGSPVDFSASALYSSFNGRTSLRTGFFQKLSGDDYTYDYTSEARDLAARNSLYRLYLGPVAQYSQFSVEAHRELPARVRLGAAIVIRRLNDNGARGPFDTSFQDYRVNSRIFPFRKIETFFEYHERDSDRLSPLYSTGFDNISTTGETSVKDLSGDIRRSFGEGRVTLHGGVYYRRISFQDPFYYMDHLHQSGVLGGASVRIDRRTRFYFDYTLDNDFFLFAPDIRNSQVFRMGAAWKY